MGRVFIIDDNRQDLNMFNDILKGNSTDIFFTENAYQFIRYAQELSPDLYIINSDMKNTNSKALIEYLVGNNFTQKAPLVTIADNPLNTIINGISHYVNRSEISAILPELAQSYCKGGRQYDVLLLEKNLSSPLCLKQSDDLSYFKVNDSHGAQIFLSKNQTKLVAVHCSNPQYRIIKQRLKNNNAIYVENVAYLNKLVSFIK